VTVISADLAQCIKEAGQFRCAVATEGQRAARRPVVFVTDITLGDVTAIGAEMVVDHHPDEFLKIGTDLLKQLCFNVDFGVF